MRVDIGIDLLFCAYVNFVMLMLLLLLTMMAVTRYDDSNG